ncbi:uncharacterized protein LOC100374506 [Saccoglossus kowalevskii]
MDLPDIHTAPKTVLLRSTSPWAVPVNRFTSNKSGIVNRDGTNTDESLRDAGNDGSPEFHLPAARESRTPVKRILMSTQSCPADIEGSELRTYSIINSSNRQNDRGDSRARVKSARKRTARTRGRERPTLFSRFSEEAKEVMKEIREEMEKEKLENSTHISDILDTPRDNHLLKDEFDSLDEIDNNITREKYADEDDQGITNSSTKPHKVHKVSIVSSTGSATNSTMTTESRSATTFTDSERDMSNGDDMVSTPPDSTRPSSSSRTSLMNDAILEDEEYSLNFDVRRNKFSALPATPLVAPRTRTRPKTYRKYQNRTINNNSLNNNIRLYGRRNQQNRMLQNPGEYTERRAYRKTPPIPIHVMNKIKQVNAEHAENTLLPSPSHSPEPPPPPPRLYKERSFQVTGPAYDIRYQQPLYYNYHKKLDPMEKKLQSESVEKCRAWLNKWVISE